MAVTEKALIAPLSDFIAAVINVRPYPGKENSIIPDEDYIIVDIVSLEPVSWSTTAERFDEAIGAPENYTQYKAILRITTFGSKAFSWCHSISDGFRDKILLKILKTNGFGYQGHTPPRDASVNIDNTKIEKRYTMSVQVSYLSGGVTTTGQADCIETVEPPTFIGEYI